MKLILITSCKPINDPDIKIIQTNSINSWINLKVDKKILVFNKNLTTKEFCYDLGVEVIDDYESSPHNDIPTWVSMKNIASEYANEDDVIVWVNSDVMFDQSLIDTINSTKKVTDNFVLVGQKYDWYNFKILDKDFNFDDMSNLVLHSEWAIDYFIFKKHVYTNVPNFFIARLRFDNFLMTKAIDDYYAIDCTKTIFCVHHRHEYGLDNDKKFSEIYNLEFWQNEQKINDSLINIKLSNIRDCKYYTEFENNEIKIKKK